MKDILKTTLVLALIAIVSGGLLGFVYTYTKVDTSNASLKKLQAVYEADEYKAVDYRANSSTIAPDIPFQLEGTGKIIKTYVPIVNGNESEKTLVMWVEASGGYGGKIQILVCIEDYVIKNIVSYSNSETPGLGGNAFGEVHLSKYCGLNIQGKQFVVKTQSKLTASDKSDPYVIQAVTSATYSSNALNNAISIAVNYYNKFADKLCDSKIEEVVQ